MIYAYPILIILIVFYKKRLNMWQSLKVKMFSIDFFTDTKFYWFRQRSYKVIVYSFLSLVCLETYSQNVLNPAIPNLPNIKTFPSFNIKESNTLKNFSNPKLRINNFVTETSSFYNKSLISTDLFSSLSNYQYTVRNKISLEFSGIPLSFEYTRKHANPLFLNDPRAWYNIGFDTDKYKERWKRLAEKVGPDALSMYGQQATALKKSIIEKIQKDATAEIKSDLKNKLDSITRGIDPATLAGKNPQELSTMFFGRDVNLLLQVTKRRIEQLQSQNLINTVKDSLLQGLEKEKKELDQKNKYITKIEQGVKKAKDAGLLDILNNLNSKSKAEYLKLLENPEQLAKTMAAKYGAGGFQKILSLLSQFKLGGQSLPISNNPNIPFSGKGLSFEIKLGDKLIGFSTGKFFPVFSGLSFLNNQGPNPTNKTENNQSSYTLIHYRKGYEDKNHKGIKLTSILTEGFGENNINTTGVKPKNLVIINLYSREKIVENNWLMLDISKTVIKKVNKYNISGQGAERAEKTDDLLTPENMTVKVSLEGKAEKAGIMHQVFYKKTLGSPLSLTDNYLTSGGYETGFTFNMRKKEKKISYFLKGSLRKYEIPGFAESSWKSTNIRSRVSYKMKKGQYVQLSNFLHSGYKNYYAGGTIRSVMQKTTGISSDLNLVNKRIFGLYNTSFISAGFQRDMFPQVNTLNKDNVFSNSYNILLNQSFLYGDHLLTLNCFYTKVSQSINTFFYNTKLDIDAGGNLKINKNIRAGSSLVFGYFKNAYTNIGIKSSLSAVVSQRFSIDLNSDLRKNIRLINPLFDQFMNMSFDLKYIIK